MVHSTLNGKDQYASLAQAEMTKPYQYDGEANGKPARLTVQGKDLASPDIDASSFLIETYAKTVEGHTGGMLVSKMADTGYQLAVNRTGGVTLTLKAGGQTVQLASGVKINDGKWHHVIAELNRTGAVTGTIYVDGVKAASGSTGVAGQGELGKPGRSAGRQGQPGRVLRRLLGVPENRPGHPRGCPHHH